jgi:hypothetical protein
MERMCLRNDVYVAPTTHVAGETLPAADYNVIVNDIIDHETRLLSSSQVIETKTLTGTAAIDFTSIPATYTNLQLIWRLRGSDANAVIAVYVTFNNDAGGNYTFNDLQNRNATVSGGVQTSTTAINGGVCPGSIGTANLFGGGNYTIYNYANTSYYKQMIYNTAYANTTAADSFQRSGGGYWASNDAINRITFSGGATSTFLIGSSVTLIGIP